MPIEYFAICFSQQKTRASAIHMAKQHVQWWKTGVDYTPISKAYYVSLWLSVLYLCNNWKNWPPVQREIGNPRG